MPKTIEPIASDEDLLRALESPGPLYEQSSVIALLREREREREAHTARLTLIRGGLEADR